MNIGVDYRLATQHAGGMGVYIRNLLSQLNKIDKKNKYILFDNNIDSKAKSSAFKKLLGVYFEQYWVQFRLIKNVVNKNINVLFSPNPPVPFFLRCPIILTIPDLAFYYDDQISFFIKTYLFISYFISSHKAKKISTFSNASKEDIKNILKIKLDKIVVIPLAATDVFRPLKKAHMSGKYKKRFAIIKPYILSTPGSFVQRKNVEGLLQAFKELPLVIKNKYQLVICANTKTKYFSNVYNRAVELGIEKDVVFTGYVEPECQELIELYNGAYIFAFPSLYEGFGLPPLEAMKCGVPVIVGNNSSLPEVVGDAGILVNNTKELTGAIVTLDKDKKLYDNLRKAGLKKAQMYSWESTAQMFKDLISTF